jgi:hypothetical protein
VGFGRKLPRGRLQVFSVADEREARDLLIQACGRTAKGEFYAEELAREQTIPNLRRFSHRLAVHHDLLKASGQCRCGS